MIKYRVEGNKITPKNVTNESDKTIWYICACKNHMSGMTESQERISGSYHKWFNTFEEAKEAVIVELGSKAAYHIRRATELQKELNSILTLTEEECLNQI